MNKVHITPSLEPGQRGPFAAGDVVALDDGIAEWTIVEDASGGVDGVVIVAVGRAAAQPVGLGHDLPGIALGRVGHEAGAVVVVAAHIEPLLRAWMPDGALVVAKDGATGALGPVTLNQVFGLEFS